MLHCRDEDLVAWLDGELNPLSAWRVQTHLKLCWTCRARLASCERGIQRFTEVVKDWTESGSAWKLQSKWRLEQGMRRVEKGLRPRVDSGRRTVRAAMAASVALAVLGVVWYRSAGAAKPIPSAREAISRAARVEEELFRNPVRQEVTVEIEQKRPETRSREGRLETWSDKATGRFASRWSMPNGVLKQALWKPANGSAVVYPASLSPRDARGVDMPDEVSLTSLADGGIDPQQIESGFLRWLQGRTWRPLSFSGDLSAWAQENGTLLRIERVRAADSSSRIRVTARRTDRRGVVAVVTLELDSETYRPKLETIRFESGKAEVELRLVSIRARPLPRSELNDDLFRPPASLAAVLGTTEPLRAGEPPMKVSTPVVPSPRVDAEKTASALNAHYALHLAGACLGEPVEIIEHPAGVLIRRRASAQTAESEILAMDTTLPDVLDALADLRDSQRDHAGPEGEHLRALQFLVERFPAGEIAGMKDKLRKILARMAASHRKAIVSVRDTGAREELERIDRILEPLHVNAVAGSGVRQSAPQ